MFYPIGLNMNKTLKNNHFHLRLKIILPEYNNIVLNEVMKQLLILHYYIFIWETDRCIIIYNSE